MSIATELTALNDNLLDAYDAVDNKGGTVPAHKNTANLATAIGSIPSGGGSIVNGIIQQYKASTSNISANTFVEFVNGIGSMADRAVGYSAIGYEYSATMLSDNVVFIAYSSYTGINSRLLGIVCTISGTSFTIGAETALSSSTTYGGLRISAITLSSTKVFIAHNGEQSTTDTGSRLYGVVCNISGTTITAGSDTLLSSTTYGGARISATAVSADKVFIAHNGARSTTNTGSRLYGIVCDISGTTITAGTDTRLSTTTYGGYNISTTMLSSADKVFIAHSGEDYTGAASRLYGIVCDISGTTITAGSDTLLSSTTYGGYNISTTMLSSADKVFIAHSGENSTDTGSRLYGVVCNISGTTITAGSDTLLSSTTYGGARISATMLSSAEVFIAHNGEGNSAASRLYGVVCTISGTTITAGTDTRLSTTTYGAYYGTSAVALSSTKIFVAHSADGATTSSRLYGAILELEPVAAPSSTKIEGLTKDAITTTTAGDVWVLNNN